MPQGAKGYSTLATTVVEYRCLLISPSDVDAERDAFSDVVERWNAQVGGALGARVHPVRWETHGVPDASAAPQAVLNRQFVDECDFGVAIFWARLGSPTTEHESGSIEEIERLRRRGAQVLIYFNTAAIPQSRLQDDEFVRLRAFKDKMRSEGFQGKYDNVGDLREQLQLHLTSVVAGLLQRERGQPSPVEVRESVSTAPKPDVRVVVYSAVTMPPTPGLDHILAIRIQNHSPVVVFVSGVSILLRNGKALLIFRDAITGAELGRTALRPGESIPWSADGDALLRAHPVEDLEQVVVHDDIGRMYKSPDGALQDVLRGFAERSGGSKKADTAHDTQADERVRRALSDTVFDLLSAEAKTDHTLLNFDRKPTTFSLSRNGHSLMFAFGSGRTIARGEIKWRAHGEADRAHRFTVTRSTSNPNQFSFNGGDAQELDDIAKRVVREYLDHT